MATGDGGARSPGPRPSGPGAAGAAGRLAIVALAAAVAAWFGARSVRPTPAPTVTREIRSERVVLVERPGAAAAERSPGGTARIEEPPPAQRTIFSTNVLANHRPGEARREVGLIEAERPQEAPTVVPAPPPVAVTAVVPSPEAHRREVGAALGALSPTVGTVSVRGEVQFVGPPPSPRTISRRADAFCARSRAEEPDRSVVVNPNRTLRNVVVRLIGVPGNFLPPPSTVMVTQRDCAYEPRVQVTLVGQQVGFDNRDQTLHNLHTYEGSRTLFNQAQLAGAAVISKSYGMPEVVKLKCDFHPWMIGYVVVTDNPFAAVTGDDGSFVLTGVPAGDYEVEAWHERYGSKRMRVEVRLGFVPIAAFRFSDADAATSR